MSAKDNVEKLVKSLEELKEKNRNIPMIVEGIKDEKALRQMGFEGQIIRLHSMMTIEKFSRNLSYNYKEVILLLDWDSKGKRLTSVLMKYLLTYGVKADFDFWKLCFSVVSQMSTVESLPSVFYRLSSENASYQHI